MSGACLPMDVIRNIFSYGDVNDIPKRKMVFDQLLFLKKEFIYHKYECSSHYHRSHYTNTQFYEYILEKNRLKMNMIVRHDKLKTQPKAIKTNKKHVKLIYNSCKHM